MLCSSMTSRSPTGTETLAGVKRMLAAVTWTVVVWPVGTTSAATAGEPAARDRPAAVGSRPTPDGRADGDDGHGGHELRP